MFNKPKVLALLGSTGIASYTAPMTVVIFSVLVASFIALRLWNIDAYSLWGTEAFAIIGIHHDWNSMFAYIIADIVHPPLFYILLKLWVAIGGESILWLKLFPVLGGIALIGPFYLLCRELGFKLPEMSLALSLAAVNEYLIHYAQEIRMYILFTFFAMCSFWLFIKFFKAEKQATGVVLGLTVVNLLAIYTHYYGWLVVGMEFLFLLIWRRKRIIIFGASIMFLLLSFSPWAYLVIREARSIGGLQQNLDWIPKPDLIDVLNFYVTLNGPLGSRYVKLFGLFLFGLPPILWFWKITRSGFKSRSEDAISFSWLALLSFLPVIAIFVISQKLAQAVWIDRYFIFSAVPYLMLVATAVYRLETKWARYTWLILLVLWSLFAGMNGLRTNRIAWGSPQLGSRVKWDGMVQQMIASESEPSGPISIYTLTVISKGQRTGDWATSTSIDYFLDSYGEDRFQTRYVRDVQTLLNKTLEDHFWIAFFELAEWPQPSPAVILKENGYRVGDAIVFQHLDNRVVLLPVWRH